MRSPRQSSRMAAAFLEMKFMLECWRGVAWGSSTIPTDEEVLGVLWGIADEFAEHGELRGLR